MTTMTTFNKNSESAKLTAVTQGVEQQLPPNVALQLLGKSWTVAQLVQLFTAAKTAMQTVQATRVQLLKDMQAQKQALQAARELYMALERYLQGLWGKGSPVLAQYGFSVQQPRAKSAAKKAVAAALGKLTRKARHTMGRRQKLAITASGSAGLLLVGPDGKPITGVTQGSTPPTPDGSSK